MTLEPDDGTAGDLLMTASMSGDEDHLTALDVADGRVRWAVPTPDDARFSIQDAGRLYLALPRALTALG